jgi:FixJ family two-component response regulator
MLPLLNFQGTIVILDDDVNFLSTEFDFLRRKNHKVEKFLSASEAINYCQQSITFNDIIPIKNVLAEEIEGSAIEIYVRQIIKIFNSTFDKEVVPVIVADYDMPEMDGLSFFRKIKKLRSYKILLTGAADESIAIKAFNEGLIDFYITKNGVDLFDKLDKIIKVGRNKYFERESARYIDIITKNEPDSLLNLEEYASFIHEYFFRKTVSKVYLLDSLGSYFLIDDNKEKILIISTEEKSEAIGALCKENKFVSKEDAEEVEKGIKIMCTNRKVSCDDDLSVHIKEAKTIKMGNKNIFYYYGNNISANGSRLIQFD